MGYVSDRERDVSTRIVNDLAQHQITVKHDDGLYRHFACQRPDTISLWFDIVTWPGNFCIRGDMGTFLFNRTTDMLAFMRGSVESFSYVAEKCIAHDGRVREWCVELWEESLKEEESRLAEDYPDKAAENAEKFADIRQNYYGMYETEHDAMRAMYESGLYDGCDMPCCKTFTFHFLWCLHAIKWFIAKLDAGEYVRESIAAVAAK